MTESITSKTGGTYFDIYIKTSPSDQKTVRVTKRSNPTLKRKCFIDKKELPVKLHNLGKGDNMLFYNNSRGSMITDEKLISFHIDDIHLNEINDIKDEVQGIFNLKALIKWNGIEEMKNKRNGSKERLREAVFIDQEKNSIAVSIWGQLIDAIQENKIVQLTNLKIHFFYDVQKLTTTYLTRAKVMGDADFDVNMEDIEIVNWKKLEADEKEKSHPTITGSIVGCQVDIYPTCISKSCRRRVTVPPGEERFSCNHCGQRLFSNKLHTGFVASVDIEPDVVEEEDDDEIMQLTCFSESLAPFFGKSFFKNFNGEKHILEDKILDLEKVIVTYSLSKNVIEEIKKQ